MLVCIFNNFLEVQESSSQNGPLHGSTLQTRSDLCFPRSELRGFVLNFLNHVSVSDLSNPTIGPPFF
jgi:hypothetical protein